MWRFSGGMSEVRYASIGARVGDLADAQRGYFTRAQAQREGIGDMHLQRAVKSRAIQRLDHGVYRISGAGSHHR